MSEHNIYQRINAVMKTVDYAKKDATVNGGGMNYKGVTHDQVLATVRPALIEAGIIVEPKLIADRWTEPRKGVEKSTNWLYEAFYRVDFVNMDDPKDRATFEISGHANDSGDKAPGNAASYAVKTAILKLFGIETGENDESRNFDANAYTDEQKEMFDELIECDNALGMHCLMTVLGEGIYINLYNSFKDQKQKKKAIVSGLMDKGREMTLTLSDEIKARIDNDDPSVTELTSELTDYEKKVISKLLRPTDIEYIQKAKAV